MWASRVLAEVTASAGPAVLAAPYCYGSYYVLAALPQAIWLDLEQGDSDPIVQGNKLADAVARALGSYLIGYGLPYRYGLNVLKQHLGLLGPMTLALSGAEHAVELAQELLALHNKDHKVVLACERLPQGLTLPREARILTEKTLALTLAEARQLSELSPAELEPLLTETQGAYERLLIERYERQQLPAPMRPTPEGPKALVGAALSAEALLTVLIKRGRYLEALALACRALPHETPKVLAAAGEYFWERGLAGQLYGLLGGLPEAIAREPRVLAARLRGALALGREAALLPEVAAVLGQEEAAELRALYAEALFEAGDSGSYLAEAERAARAEATPLTLYSYGRALGLCDPEVGLGQLERGLRLAEARGERLLAAQIAKALASRQSLLGRYRAAVYWAEWGQKLYRESDLKQVALRLSLLNEWAYARLLQGSVAGLEPLLRAEIANLASVHPSLAERFQTTLADLLLSQGQRDEAVAIYRELWCHNRRRERVGALSNLLVRALVEVGEVEQALEVAEQAQELTRGLDPLRQKRAQLAYGMALSFSDAAQAITILEPLLTDFGHPLLAERLAQTGLYLARAYLLVGEAEKAHSALRRAEAGLRELGESGFRYLAGPEAAFCEVKQLLSRGQPELELRFLGAAEARLRGKPLLLRLRFAEMLAALALNPQGLTSEQLTLAVYGEAGSVRGCMVELGRLRRLVPIVSRPYRLGVDVSADFVQLEQLLASNRLREALALYQGPLLPSSDAPVVVELRAFLEEALRQAVLSSDDPEALWALAERLGDDLEVWERTLALLGEHDLRAAIARAQVEGLVKRYCR